MAKHKRFTPEKRAEYLELISKTGVTSSSAYLIGISTLMILQYSKENPEFAAQVDEAKARYRDGLHTEAHRRGAEGWDEPVYQGGREVGKVRKHSDRMLELLLKRHIPEFRDKLDIDTNVKGGVLVVGAPPVNDEEWKKRFSSNGQ